MDYKNISQRTLQESKNIPAPNKPKKLNIFFWLGLLCAAFAIFFFCFIPNAIEEEDGVFIFILNFLMFGGFSIFFFYSSPKMFAQQCKDYELSKSNFREYQITIQLRKEKAEQQRQQQIQNTLNDYDKLKKEEEAKKYNYYKYKCPMCNSNRITKISTAKKVVSTGMFGMASQQIGKNYQCDDCKYMW